MQRRSAPVAILVGLACGLCAVIVWYIAEGTALAWLAASNITESAESEDWVLFTVGSLIALGSGVVSAKGTFRGWPPAAIGTSIGLLAGFWLPDLFVNGHVSVLLAGDETLVPTLVALPLSATFGAWLAARREV